MTLDRREFQSKLDVSYGQYDIFSLHKLEESGFSGISKLPISLRVLLESVMRNLDGHRITEAGIAALGRSGAGGEKRAEIGFMPARVLLQDFTGVPAIVDLAAMRAAVARRGGDPCRVDPHVPVDLVIDHSVQVDRYGTADSLAFNAQREFERNGERYEFLKWGQSAFHNLRVVPPATGIVHQVNLEYLAKVVQSKPVNGRQVAYPDSLVGTDSHTTMINGLGVLGWGVGGIEAEAVMLGQPLYMLIPDVVGFRLEGALPEGATATDLVLTITEMLRAKGVVGKFVEFLGGGLDSLSIADRATIANMAPEYGATIGFFPVDNETLSYMRSTGRDDSLIELVEVYNKEQGMFRHADSTELDFVETVTLDMSRVESSVAGPKRPQDRVSLRSVKGEFLKSLAKPTSESGYALSNDDLRSEARVRLNGSEAVLRHGSIVIAAISSCTNTSNPSVMIASGLLAKKAVERGLKVPEYVKTSFAPGSKVVVSYLEKSRLMPYLERLGFNLVGFGCTTCIGNSGPLSQPVATTLTEGRLVAAAVLSGNRNFEGRINPLVRAAYLASPPLVVAYALAGRVDIDLQTEPIGVGGDGRPVFLREIWPSQAEIGDTLSSGLDPSMFREQYSDVFAGDSSWAGIAAPRGDLYEWKPESTYIREPDFFSSRRAESGHGVAIAGARVLALFGDSVTTDHISPAGAIAKDSPAGKYLTSLGIDQSSFNSYGSRRGNHEVMMRGTFANIRVKNLLVPGVEGGMTVYHETGQRMSIYDASVKYSAAGIPLVVIAGKDYGMGSSRDWAAKGAMLLGVRAVLFESIERIHRSNLVGMGILPLQFMPGESAAKLGIVGDEVFDFEPVPADFVPGSEMKVVMKRSSGGGATFRATVRLDTPIEVEYYRNGGILNTVLKDILGK